MTQERKDELKEECLALYQNGHVKLTVLDDLLDLLDTAMPADGSTSDGYHTFDELYDQRAVLFAALCRAYPDKAWRSKLHHDGTMFDGGYFICGIETIKGQYTYHYKLHRWDLFDDCKTLDYAPEWNGHTDKDVERLLFLPDGQPVMPADAEVAIVDACYRKLEIAVGYAESIENSDDYRTALNMIRDYALSAYRRPTAEEVEQARVALTWFEDDGEHEIVSHIKTSPDYQATLPDNVVKTIVMALRRMKGREGK